MNKIYILWALCWSFLLFGQAEKADQLFERTAYLHAIPLYEAIQDKSEKHIERLAESYYHTFQYDKANLWYAKLMNRSMKLPKEQQVFRMTHALKASGKRKKAKALLKSYFQKTGEREALIQLELQDRYLDDVAALGDRYAIFHIPEINSPYSEFSPFVKDSILYFAAPKREKSLFSKSFDWNKEPYLDIYQTNIHLNDKVISLEGDINTKEHEGSLAITGDGNWLYFSRNMSVTKNNAGSKKAGSFIGLYRAKNVDGAWKSVELLPFNGSTYSCQHPALSADGKWLYFSSNRPGGFGGMDLYVVSIETNGFGEPINLGAHINTKQKEQFPYIGSQGQLYFASDGHPGFGLMDLFVAKKKINGFEKPDNLGRPINSPFDDFAIFVFPNDKTGYFSSNRPGGLGMDDIYAFKETKPLNIQSCEETLCVKLVDKDSNALLENGTVLISDDVGSSRVKLGETAMVPFELACETNYKIKGYMVGYQPKEIAYQTMYRRGYADTITIALQNFEAYEKEQEGLALAKKVEAQQRTAKEDKLREIAMKQQLIKMARKETYVHYHNNRIFIEVDPIRFDYNKWFLRMESENALDRVVDIMKKYPKIVLEIGAHTDIRGQAAYNQLLSEKRAESVKAYLIQKGLDVDRISAVGYGETQPLVICETTNCSEKQHALNRRCEFVLRLKE